MDARALPVSEDLTFKQQQEARERFGDWYAETFEQAVETFGRLIFQALGRPYFWDLPPRERRAVYGSFPPVLLDGQTPAPYAGAGPWNWPAVQQNHGAEFDRVRNDYTQLLRQEIKRVEIAIEAGILREQLAQEVKPGE